MAEDDTEWVRKQDEVIERYQAAKDKKLELRLARNNAKRAIALKRECVSTEWDTSAPGYTQLKKVQTDIALTTNALKKAEEALILWGMILLSYTHYKEDIVYIEHFDAIMNQPLPEDVNAAMVVMNVRTDKLKRSVMPATACDVITVKELRTWLVVDKRQRLVYENGYGREIYLTKARDGNRWYCALKPSNTSRPRLYALTLGAIADECIKRHRQLIADGCVLKY